MALRIKNLWFREDHPRSLREVAGAAAFIVWRVAGHVLQNMRRADFDILPGPAYFDFLAEWLVFLIQVADRIAYAHLGAEERVEFTSSLANRVAEIQADNRVELLGARPPGEAASAALPGRHPERDCFIDLLNLRSQDYADFEIDPRRLGTPVARYLAERLLHVLGERDRMWVHDQVMEIEAPDAALQVQRGLDGLLGLTPRPARRRAGVAGE
ncbi:MAG TPA: hypothetical protein PLW24_05095 [Burkholderiaceae bacterium]|nr:hypothetical protein [Burkholderiaceae bacterium]HNB43561.1 hypothetical protein [Burkholderiaceae bacterium]HNG78824.1 hypothetical protein [Burkholderiaceae bacterium]